MSVVIEEVVGASAAELLAAGNQAYVDDDFDGALAKYSAALEALPRGGGGGSGGARTSSSPPPPPSAASLHAVRAQAFIRLEDHVNAVAEANRAIEADPGLQKGYLRKGVACFWLEEYETAKAAFQTGMGLGADEGPEPYRTWIRKCDAELEDEDEDEGEADADAAAVAPPPAAAVRKAAEPPKDAPQPPAAAAAPETTASSSDPASAAAGPPAPKYRHQWFQSPAAVTLSIMAKGIKAERAIVDIRATTVRVHIKAPGSDEDLEYALDLELCGAIDPDASKVEFLSTKIEIRLPKADSTGNWPSLERSEASAAAAAAAPVAAAAAAAAATPHPYPTSYSADRKQVKDWDKIESEMKEEEKEEKLEGDAALQKLFRDIYGNADEETRRAMNKSFVESNGTVLSTNWKEIGAKTVECTPPSGMEAKKYEA